MIEDRDCAWLYWCPGLTLERWREECRLVEERFSLFRAFAEAPFLGFRGIVARSGSEYRVTVAAEMDMYPKYQPWVFVTPPIAGDLMEEDSDLALDGACAATPAGVFGTLLGDSLYEDFFSSFALDLSAGLL